MCVVARGFMLITCCACSQRTPTRPVRPDQRDSLGFCTPRISDRSMQADAEEEDLVAAGILTELSGSFHLVNGRKNSPASVRQPSYGLLNTLNARSPSTMPSSRAPLNWGARLLFTCSMSARLLLFMRDYSQLCFIQAVQ